jgi:lysozyme family protein
MAILDTNLLKNIAGVGYIQGALKNYLDVEFFEHEVKVDGMFGPATLAGLNAVSNDRHHITAVGKSNVVKAEHIFNRDDYTLGISFFQDWYKELYDKLKELNRGKSFPVPQTDGYWGPKTKKCIDHLLGIPNND